MTISINQQIEEIERELAHRASLYPRLISAGKLRQGIADYQVERLRAAKASLEWLRDNEHKIKQRMTY